MTPVSGLPAVSNTRSTSFTVSTTKPFPTHRPWSGGSSENWLPPLAVRWSRWFRPSMVRTNCGSDLTAADAAAAPAWVRSPRERLRLVAATRPAAALAAAASASRSSPGGNSGCWMAPSPIGPPRIAVVPLLGICRVVVSARAGAPRVPTSASAAHATRPAPASRPALSCGSWPLRSLARADVGASCSRGWRGQKGRRSASAASSPGLGHAASFAGPARGRLHEQADGDGRGTLTITPDRVNRPIPTS